MSIFLRSDTNKAYYCRISSRTGDIINYLFEERHIMQNSEKNQTPENIIRIVDLVAAIFQRIKLKSLDKSAEKSLCM